MYKIELTDGTKLEGLKVNGNHFISTAGISREVFSRNLAKVRIECDNPYPMDREPEPGVEYDTGEMCGEYEHMKLAKYEVKADGSVWFVLREQRDTERELSALRADVDYMMMLTEEM